MKHFIFTLFIFINISVDAQYINTIAGGFTGDNAIDTLAEVNNPLKVTIDRNGNLFIADFYNNRIRKVSAGTGIISTVAGKGTSGFSGDGSSALDAELDGPSSVTVDSIGNLFIADYNNNRIRKVDKVTGIISTFAGNGTKGFSGDGGIAIAAQFSSVIDLKIDRTGNLYIADAANNRIRKINTNGIISTVAGTGVNGYNGDGGTAITTSLNNPKGIDVDINGNLFIADTYNSRIRKVNVSTGIISTVIGSGVSGYSGDGGVATVANIYAPDYISVDKSGNILFKQSSPICIRRVNISTNVISTVAGNGSATDFFNTNGALATSISFLSAGGIAADTANNFYFAQNSPLNRVRKVSLNNGIITNVIGNFALDTTAGSGKFRGDGLQATAAQLNMPIGVTTDINGNIYIADYYNSRVRKVSSSTGIISTIAGDGTYGINGDGGAANLAQLTVPAHVKLDALGNIYIADGNRIRRVDKITGIITTVTGKIASGFSGDGSPAIDALLHRPSGLAFDRDGNLLIADTDNQRIRKVTSNGIITTIAGSGPTGNSSGAFAGDGGQATAARLGNPSGLSVDANNNIYIADDFNECIRKINSAGVISTIAGTPNSPGFSGDGGLALSAQFGNPSRIELDKHGNLFVVDDENGNVRKINLNTNIITTIAGTGITGFNGDGGDPINARFNNGYGEFYFDIAVDSSDNIYIADCFNNRIRKISAASSTTTYTFIGTGNYDVASNWQGSLLPPGNLPAGSEIVINHSVNGECKLNISQTVLPGGKFTVLTGKKITIQGNLNIIQ